MARRQSAGRHLACVLALAACLLSWAGCTGVPGKPGGRRGSAYLSVTRDFGRERLKSVVVPDAGGRTVMEALESAARVGKAYGGGFVESIDGISSGGSRDWFYWVNGILSPVGASQYRLSPGDHVWWDYHRWGEGNFIPAVVGCYPRPFTAGLNGIRLPTTVICAGVPEELGRLVGGYLRKKGAEPRLAFNLGKLERARESGPVIILAGRGALGDEKVARYIQGQGTFLKLGGEGLQALGPDGKPSAALSGSYCAVVATGSGIGDRRPVWTVYSSDPDAAQAAGRLLTDDAWRLREKVGVVFWKGKTFSLPFGVN